jgi:hypothetical protein
MMWDCCRPAIDMPIKYMATFLTAFYKVELENELFKGLCINQW